MSILTNIYLGNPLISYLQLIIIILAAIIVGKAIYHISKAIIRIKAQKTKSKPDDILVGVLEKPIVFLLFIIGLYAGTRAIIMSSGIELLVKNAISILLIVDIAWFIIFIVDALLTYYITPMAEKNKTDLDYHLLPFLKKIVTFAIIGIALIIIIDRFGYDVTSLIAGLGIGGLALALAAKDLLANIFGGIAIVTDKPFRIGDRIRVDTKDGWVREIGMRTTRIESIDGTMVIIPNSRVADTVIENVSKEKMRKVKMNLGLVYDTSSKKLEEAKKIVEEIIKKNKETDNENVTVNFSDFADSSLNLEVIYWIKNLDNIAGVKHNVNSEIKKRFEKAGIEFAFPSRTVYLKK